MTEGSLYEFKIAAVNLAGIGQPSDPSELFKCEAWTMPEPGTSPLWGPECPVHAWGWPGGGRCGGQVSCVGVGNTRAPPGCTCSVCETGCWS